MPLEAGPQACYALAGRATANLTYTRGWRPHFPHWHGSLDTGSNLCCEMSSEKLSYAITIWTMTNCVFHTGAGQHLAAVGTWTMQLLLLSLPDMQLLREEQLGGEVILC